MKAANRYLIGTDPEFAILNNSGSIVTVEAYLGFSGKLGSDHGSRVVEIRPDPKHVAAQICADIFRQLNRRELVPLRQYKWRAGGVAGGQSVGGHIHLDVPVTGADLAYIPALDRMSEWFDTLELWPTKGPDITRRQNYGQRGQYRQAGRNRLEYRTPPSWLYSPQLAHLALTAFKLAAVDPHHTLDTLHDPDIRPVTKFRDFIRGFAEADDDAAEIAPELQKRGGLDTFRGDPNTDIKLAWGVPAAPSESEPATVETQPAPNEFAHVQGPYNTQQDVLSALIGNSVSHY